MSAIGRLIAFVASLAVVFAGGWALGNAVGPFDDSPPPAHTEHTR